MVKLGMSTFPEALEVVNQEAMHLCDFLKRKTLKMLNEFWMELKSTDGK